MSSWQPCGRRLRECIDDVCRSMGGCAWPPETPAGLDTGGKEEGAADSVSSEVTAAPSPADRNRDSNRRGGHERTRADKGARDQR